MTILGAGTRKHEGKTYRVIYGRMKGETRGSLDQAYRYPTSAWTETQARSHCKAHKGILFEPATPEGDEPKRDLPEWTFLEVNMMAPFTEFGGIISIPTIFTRQGVQNGGFKPFEELVKAAPTLNGKPVIFWHPPERRPVDWAQDMVVGWCSDIEARANDTTLHGTTNIRVDAAPPEFIEGLRKGENREGSVGFWANAEYVRGSYRNTPYSRIERNIYFDHYAVGLPLGACPVSEGCGLGFDEEGGGEMSDTIDLAEMEGEKLVCLNRLKEFVLDIFRRNYGKAPEDKPWDLDKSKYSEAQASYASAVVEKPGTSDTHSPGYTGEDLTKAMCRLIHHLPGDGKSHGGTLVWIGVSTAGAAIQGSRGGVKFSTAARAKAKTHLERHYHEFKRKAPWEPGRDEDMQFDEEERRRLETRIMALEKEKIDLASEKADLESERTTLLSEKDTWVTEKGTLITERDDLKTWKEESEPKLQAFTAAQTQTEEQKKAELLTSIAGLSKEEVNDEFKAKYEGWTNDQLEHFAASLKRSTDMRAAVGPRGIVAAGPGDTGGETSIEVRGKKLTVGGLFQDTEPSGQDKK